MSNPEYLSTVDSSFLRILQIEHRRAIENLDDILRVEGIDLLICGPNDLSASYGHLCDTRNPEMLSAYDLFADKCRQAGMPFGVSLGAGDRASILDWGAPGRKFYRMRRRHRLFGSGVPIDLSFSARESHRW